jgi:hypothetical protein
MFEKKLGMHEQSVTTKHYNRRPARCEGWIK